MTKRRPAVDVLRLAANLDALRPEVVLPRLDDPQPQVREHAVRLAENVLHDSPAVREKLYAMVDDADLRVRYQLAFTLGEIPGAKATRALAAVAARDGGKPVYSYIGFGFRVLGSPAGSDF